MSHAFANLLYHIIFSTKNRELWIDGELRPRLVAYLGGLIGEEVGVALIVNGVADHVHLLVRLHQDAALSQVVRHIKARSSFWIHKTFPERAYFCWQTGYGAFSVSQSQANRVRRYIADQESHHRKRTFQQEFRAYLHANGLVFDEKTVWD